MSDDHSQNSDSPSSKKGFFSLILNQLFHGEPKNREDLLELIRDSEQNELIDQDTRDMLEGKRLAARYFMEWELPTQKPALELVARLDRTALDAPSAYL